MMIAEVVQKTGIVTSSWWTAVPFLIKSRTPLVGWVTLATNPTQFIDYHHDEALGLTRAHGSVTDDGAAPYGKSSRIRSSGSPKTGKRKSSISCRPFSLHCHDMCEQ